MRVLRVHHIGIAVRDLEEALRFFSEVLGLEVEDTVIVEDQGMKAAWLSLGDVKLEVMEPLGPDTPVGRFLDRRGEGVHHISVLVDDIGEVSERLREAGVRLVYEEARKAYDGSLINFLHPKTAHGVLIELRQEEG